MNLTPTSSLGECYLVPYGVECRLQIGYRGYVALARRSGEIAKVTAFVVYDGDYFVWRNGTNEEVDHLPSENSANANVRAAVAMAVYTDGTKQFDVMWKHEIDAIRKMSKADGRPDSIWAKHYPEMAKKTVIRRLVKLLPLTIDGLNAVEVDDSNEFRDGQTYTIDGNTGEIAPVTAKPVAPRKVQTAVAAPPESVKPAYPAHVLAFNARIKAVMGTCTEATLEALLKRNVGKPSVYLTNATPEQLTEVTAALDAIENTNNQPTEPATVDPFDEGEV
jgi:recombinational DNA repair protein RecT